MSFHKALMGVQENKGSEVKFRRNQDLFKKLPSNFEEMARDFQAGKGNPKRNQMLFKRNPEISKNLPADFEKKAKEFQAGKGNPKRNQMLFSKKSAQR